MTDKGTVSFDARSDVCPDQIKRNQALVKRMQAVWDSAQPIAGTQAETYLRANGIDFCPNELRYLAYCKTGDAANKTAHPAMIAAVRDNDGLIAVEQTFLHSDGRALADIANPKQMLGAPCGGLGRWGVTPGKIMRLAETIEEAASAMVIGSLGIPVWPVFDSARYVIIDIPSSVERIIIYTEPGDKAAEMINCAMHHLTAGGRVIDVVIPPGDASWNAYLRRIRAMAPS
jgi:putative DNA primase/helicase